MVVTIFSKKRTTKDGKPFNVFVANLTKKDGSKVYCNVKFADGIEPPRVDVCPVNIDIEKTNANLSQKVETTEDGNVYEHNTLWVKKYEFSKTLYVDESLNDFE